MKPATDPSNGEVVETTTRRRILPANEQSKPDLWEYLQSLGNDANKWAKHMVYVYLVEGSSLRPVIRCSEAIAQMPDGSRVAIADQQEVEFALARVSGGTYRILVKSGAQIVSAETIAINAPVRQIPQPLPQQSTQSAPGAQFGNDPTAMVAGKAIDAIAGREHDAVNIGLGMMNTAANVVRNFADGGRPASGQDELMREVLAELRAQRRGMSLQEILAAGASIVSLLKELGIFGGNANPMVGQVMEVAMKRLLEPPAPSGSPVNTSTALVQALPTIGSQFVEGLRSYAAARQSEERIVAMQRATAPGPAQPNPQMLPPASPTNGAAQTAPTQGQSVETVQRKIIEIFHQPISATDAADQTMAYLESIDQNANAQLAALGEDGLLQMFASAPVLKVATANLPRLTEFIRAFLRMHAEDVAAESGKQPEAAKQPLPN